MCTGMVFGRWGLAGASLRLLVLGFAFAIAVTSALALGLTVDRQGTGDGRRVHLRHHGAGGRQHGARHRDLAGLGHHRLRGPARRQLLGMVLSGTGVLALQQALWHRLMARTEALFGLRCQGSRRK